MFAAIKLRKTAKFWLLSSLMFIILSLGPMLHVNGASSFTTFHVNIPLPELLLYYAFPIFRAPARFIVMATLCLAVVSAISVRYANGWIGKLKKGKLIGLLLLISLSTALLVETNMLPYPIVEDTSVPQFYHEIAKMNSTFSILDLPQTYRANNLYMYYAAISGKPLTGGTTSRRTPESFQLQEAIPVIRQTNNVLSGENLTEPTDIFLLNVNLTNLNAFQFFNIKYVILHKDLMDDTTFKTITPYLSSLLGPPVYSDYRIVSFETKGDTLQGIFAFFTSGWWNMEQLNGVPTRWMDNTGTIQVVSPTSQYCTVNFTVGTDNADKTLKVFVNGEWMGDVKTSIEAPETVSMDVLFRKGNNELSFSSDKSFVPADVNAKSSDTRRLSVYIQNVQISPD